MSWDAFQERMFLETQLEKRMQFFLFFFIGSIIISLIISQKEIAMIFLVVAVIVIWLLTVSLWFFVNRVNAADKALAASAGTGPRFMERGLRFFLAKVLPVTASILLTSFLLVGISGVADSILPYKQKVLQVVEKGKNKIESVYSKKPEVNNFESVDSVIEEGKAAPRKGAEVTFDNSVNRPIGKEVLTDVQTQPGSGTTKPAPKKVNVMLAVDGSHQAPKQEGETTRDNVPSSPTNTQGAVTNLKADPYFAPIERVIEKTQAETIPALKRKTPVTRIDTIKKKIPPNPNFKEIEKVIKK